MCHPLRRWVPSFPIRPRKRRPKPPKPPSAPTSSTRGRMTIGPISAATASTGSRDFPASLRTAASFGFGACALIQPLSEIVGLRGYLRGAAVQAIFNL
jgi:hypothetical protein